MSAQVDPNAVVEDDAADAAEDLAVKLKSLESSNAGLRGELRKRDEALKKFQDEKMTEQERVTKERDEYKAAVAERDRQIAEVGIQSEALRIAAKLGFADPGDAFALINRSALVLDADGRATNLEELLKSLMAAKPYLAGQARTGGTANPGFRPAQPARNDINAAIRRAAGVRG